MGTLLFVCPTTGHQVSAGVEVDIIQLQEPTEDEDGNLLSLSQNHLLSRIWAWLDSSVPEGPVGHPADKSVA